MSQLDDYIVSLLTTLDVLVHACEDAALEKNRKKNTILSKEEWAIINACEKAKLLLPEYKSLAKTE